MKNMFRLALMAARLNRDVFTNVCNDPSTIVHCTGIVILLGIAMGLGLMGIDVEKTNPLDPNSILERLVGVWIAVMTTLVCWILWSTVTYVFASKFLGGKGKFRNTVRALGVSCGPGILMLFNNIPAFGFYAWVIGSMWVFAVSVMAVHEINDVDWLGAFLSTLVGWCLCFVFLPEVLLRPLLTQSIN